ncbi:hypothetical protein NYA22BAC_03278 [Parasphingorhabdus sp. NYA22]
MLNGKIRSQIDKKRNDLWSGGVSNPLTGVEKINNLLLMRRLDYIQSCREAEYGQSRSVYGCCSSAVSEGPLC